MKLVFRKDEKSAEIRIVIPAQGTELTAEKLTIKSPAPEQLKEFTGDYSSAELESVYTLYPDKDKLMVRVKKNPPIPLEMTDQDTFTSPEFKLIFNRNPENQISGFILDAGRVKNLVFERR